jgi:hypothetical protein
MIEKNNKLYIDEKDSGIKFDKNEDYGAIVGMHGMCSFWQILKEFYFGKYKITVSKGGNVYTLGKQFKRGVMFAPQGDFGGKERN